MKNLLPVYMKLHPCRATAAGNHSRTFSHFFQLVKIFSLTVFIAATFCANAQSTTEQQKAAYKKTIIDRVSKIVNTLSITDSAKYKNVLSIISDQYFSLSNIQEQNTNAVADIKKQVTGKDKQAEALKGQEEKKSAELVQLHNSFIAHLKDNLNEEQVDKIKDGMTYRVFPITYTAYQDMIPSLTAVQKDKIYAWLKEARELAMDAESSDKKHAVFGKYKGRINNYLSAEGYDVKKEGEEWAKRVQLAKEAKQKTN